MTDSDQSGADALATPGARRMRWIEQYGVFGVVILMMVVLTVLEPDIFPTTQNLTNILRQVAMNALLALGLYLVILTAGIDLSVGSIMALATMLLAMADTAGVPWPVAILVGPAVGIACGLVNGLGLTVLKLPHPFIMTLGTLYTLRGITNLGPGAGRYLGCRRRFDFWAQAKFRCRSLASSARFQ